MFTGRQKDIISYFQREGSSNNYSVAQIAEEFKVTTRTIQNDLKAINDLSKSTGFRIAPIQGRKYSLIIDDEKKFADYIENALASDQGYGVLTQKKDRVNYIITTLLFSKEPILADKLSYDTAISRSQLSLDLKDAKKHLKKYDLKINTKSHNGIFIEGSEQNKRNCILREKLDYGHFTQDYSYFIDRRKISDIVIDVLNYEHYILSDLVLQNLIVHIEMSISRLLHGNTIRNIDLTEGIDIAKELMIARKIYRRIGNEYRIHVGSGEILYLAINLFSKKIYNDPTNNEAEDTNRFAFEILQAIKEKYGIDLTNDVEIRINLSLHIVPLLVRARNGLLMQNVLLTSIKEKLTLAYDVAFLAGNMIENKYHIVLNDDEIGFLAAHFSVALARIKNRDSDDIKILIITANRKSECLLLKYSFQKEFAEYVDIVDVINVNDYQENILADYDMVVSTTDLPKILQPKGILKIDYFMRREDKENIEQALLHIRECKPLLRYFAPDCFIGNAEYDNREECLKDICKRMDNVYHYKTDLYEAVMKRETLGSTVFNDCVLLTHPETLFSDETTVGVVILKEPMVWNEIWDNVQIIFLMNVEKNKSHEIAYLYDFFSLFVQDKKTMSELIKDPTYEHFQKIISYFATLDFDSETML